MNTEAEVRDLIDRLLIRSRIRRSIDNRKSVQLGEPDRICDLLEEAANVLDEFLRKENAAHCARLEERRRKHEL